MRRRGAARPPYLTLPPLLPTPSLPMTPRPSQLTVPMAPGCCLVPPPPQPRGPRSHGLLLPSRLTALWCISNWRNRRTVRPPLVRSEVVEGCSLLPRVRDVEAAGLRWLYDDPWRFTGLVQEPPELPGPSDFVPLQQHSLSRDWRDLVRGPPSPPPSCPPPASLVPYSFPLKRGGWVGGSAQGRSCC